MGDALAPRGEEGRDKLRKAAGIGTYEMIRRYPNGTTRPREAWSFRTCFGRLTRGTETSKYPQEEKTTVISQVVASERERAQTATVTAIAGL